MKNPSPKKINLQRKNRLSLNKSQIIFDPETRQRYIKGKKLGGGGFGEVYEFINIDTDIIYAGKIIPIKKIEKNPLSNAAFNNESKFNKNLNFEYICKCHSIFKDNQNAYFILDYHPNKTLNELIKERNGLSEFEVKYYGYQLLLAIQYLHNCNIIHRDLKLGNILISDKMEVKLCDFGLAIENGGDGSQTTCGTPNYIAPEVLIRKNNNNNYSFEVDIWSFGVILYILLFNKTPFEDETQAKTKFNIINVIYNFPNNIHVSDDAKDIIIKIFSKEPYLRPKVEEIKAHPFFNNGKGIPKYLPTSTLKHPLSDKEIENLIENALINDECLDKEDVNLNSNNFYSSRRLNFMDNLRKNYTTNNNNNIIHIESEEEKSSKEKSFDNENEESEKNSENNSFNNSINNSNNDSNNNNNNSNNNNSLNLEKKEKMKKLINEIPQKLEQNEEKKNKNNETGGFIDSNLIPIEKSNNYPIIVEKFIDCSNKYGIGYLLSNGDVGVFFNDGTKMILIKNTYNILYINRNNDYKVIIKLNNENKNSELEGKRNILQLFYHNLIKNHPNKNSFKYNPLLDKKSISSYVLKWVKTPYASFFLLTSQLIQVIYNDKTEILFLLQDKSIQYIDKKKKKFKEIFDINNPIKYKNEDMNKRVVYAKNILSKK